MTPTYHIETGPRGGLRYVLSTEHGQFHGNSKAEARAQAMKAKRPGVTVEQYRALLAAVDAARGKFLPVDGVARGECHHWEVADRSRSTRPHARMAGREHSLSVLLPSRRFRTAREVRRVLCDSADGRRA